MVSNLPSQDPYIVLAPMEGVIDAPMRALFSSRGGYDRMVCEFIRITDKLLPPHVFYKYCPELKYGGRTKEGLPVYVQLLGGRAEVIAENAALAVELGAPGIDLNFGCPAPTVNRHDGGATLLKNPERVFEVVSAVRKAVPPHTPVTAKVRLGFSHKDFCVQIAQAADSAGAANLVVHARTRDEGYRPPAHWQYIAQMREVSLKTKVIANGDIWNVNDYFRCREITGCSDVALGRGAVAFPDLARSIKAAFRNEQMEQLSWPELQSSLFRQFLDTTYAYRDENYTVARTKQWMKQLSRQYKEAEVLFHDIKVQKSLQDIRHILGF